MTIIDLYKVINSPIWVVINTFDDNVYTGLIDDVPIRYMEKLIISMHVLNDPDIGITVVISV